jgi:hypothetical protein
VVRVVAIGRVELICRVDPILPGSRRTVGADCNGAYEPLPGAVAPSAAQEGRQDRRAFLGAADERGLVRRCAGDFG